MSIRLNFDVCPWSARSVRRSASLSVPGQYGTAPYSVHASLAISESIHSVWPTSHYTTRFVFIEKDRPLVGIPGWALLSGTVSQSWPARINLLRCFLRRYIATGVAIALSGRSIAAYMTKGSLQLPSYSSAHRLICSFQLEHLLIETFAFGPCCRLQVPSAPYLATRPILFSIRLLFRT